MRKYIRYEVVTEEGEITFLNYREAFSFFMHISPTFSATMFGVDEFNNYSVIRSKFN